MWRRPLLQRTSNLVVVTLAAVVLVFGERRLD